MRKKEKFLYRGKIQQYSLLKIKKNYYKLFKENIETFKWQF